MTKLSLSSPDFKEFEFIPKKHTSMGEDISPELRFANPPKNTKSFALAIVDPDAPGGDFIHWVIYNIPGKEDHLPGNILKKPFLENGIKQEKNDFGSIGYGGPCPPKTETHSYIFTLYALDSEIVLNPGSAYQELQKAMKGHILEEAKLTGYFSK